MTVTPESVRATRSSLSTHVFSHLYFQLPGDVSFPEDYWDDFSAIVLSWWLNDATMLLAGSSSTFHFMDGPYIVEAKPCGVRSQMSFIDNRVSPNTVIHRCEMETRELCRTFIAAANVLIRHLPDDTHDWKDVRELSANMASLQRHMKRSQTTP